MAKNLGIAQADLFVILHISARTWQRYTDDKRLPPDVSERALQLAALDEQGNEVFGESWRFDGWMNHPSVALGGKKPITILDSTFGFKLISDEIIRIEYGVLV